MAKVMSISRLRTGTDGKGLTTLVGFSGCPLKCRYCLNDECHDSKIGKDYSVEELIKLVSIDSIYFGITGGGITFGGGEPLLNADFIEEFCKKCDKRWKIRIETSLNVDREAIETLVDYIDKWFVDIKDTNPGIYKEYTETDNSRMLDNLKFLYDKVGPEGLHLRIPLIPRYNTQEDIERTKYLLRGYACKKEYFTYKC